MTNLFTKIKGQLTRHGTSLQVEYEMLEQLSSCLLADTDHHDTLQFRIKQKRKNCTRGTCVLPRCEWWHPWGS